MAAPLFRPLGSSGSADREPRRIRLLKCVFHPPSEWADAMNFRHSAARDIPTDVYIGGIYSYGYVWRNNASGGLMAYASAPKPGRFYQLRLLCAARAAALWSGDVSRDARTAMPSPPIQYHGKPAALSGKGHRRLSSRRATEAAI